MDTGVWRTSDMALRAAGALAAALSGLALVPAIAGATPGAITPTQTRTLTT
jgi:hypothetical protein